MQARPRFRQILLVLVTASLVLGACGGGGGTSTAFNLPSLPLTIQADGTGRVFGFSTGSAPLLAPALIGQFQAANVQKLEIRIGHNGIHFYANGQDLPYIAWNDQSVATLQDVVRTLPMVPNGDTVANLLPWMRRVGLGVSISLPQARGAPVLNIPRWQGETRVTVSRSQPIAIGPFTLASLVYDRQGNPSIEGVPVSQLEQALGLSLGLTLDAAVTQILTALRADQVTVTTQPNGIDLKLNDRALPGIAYDSAYLQRTLSLVTPLLNDPQMSDLLGKVLPALPGTSLNVLVSFTGEAAGETALAPIRLAVEPDGGLALFGIPLGLGAVFPPDLLQKFQAADVQQLDLTIAGDTLHLASNGHLLPSLSWTDVALESLPAAIGPLVGMAPGGLESVITIVRNLVQQTNVGVSAALPLAEGAVALEIPAEMDLSVAMQAPDLGGFAAPVLRVGAAYQRSSLQFIGPFSASDLAALGLGTILDLPANLTSILDNMDVNKLQAVTHPGQLDLVLDGDTALSLKYDLASLQETLALAQPFLAGTILEDPGIASILQTNILPLVPGSVVNLTVAFNP